MQVKWPWRLFQNELVLHLSLHQKNEHIAYQPINKQDASIYKIKQKSHYKYYHKNGSIHLAGSWCSNREWPHCNCAIHSLFQHGGRYCGLDRNSKLAISGKIYYKSKIRIFKKNNYTWFYNYLKSAANIVFTVPRLDKSISISIPSFSNAW